MPGVYLVTCAELPDGDEDGAALLSGLRAEYIDSRWIAWDAPEVDWAADLAVIRSTWDYTPRRDDFLAWARSVPRLANPFAVVSWNSDKTYLRDLAVHGVPIVPTTWLAPGEVVVLPEHGEYVVKPSVGAGSRGAGRFAADAGAAARAHAARLHDAGRVVLVQPYLTEVDTVGETALIYFDGEFSHAVRKGAMLPEGVAHPVDGHDLYVEEVITPHTATAGERAVGDEAIDVVRRRFGTDLLYARVDLLPSSGGPVVVELELTEPSLFLGHSAGAVDRFVAAIARHAGSRR